MATWFLLGYLTATFGLKWTLAIGATSWFLLYVIYYLSRPRWLIVVGQGFHGLAYVLFIIAGQIYVSQVAPKAIGSSAQGLLSLATNGFGLFLGTQLAGLTMQRATQAGRIQWRRVWIVPLAVALTGAVVLATAFQGRQTSAAAAAAEHK